MEEVTDVAEVAAAEVLEATVEDEWDDELVNDAVLKVEFRAIAVPVPDALAMLVMLIVLLPVAVIVLLPLLVLLLPAVIEKRPE